MTNFELSLQSPRSAAKNRHWETTTHGMFNRAVSGRRTRTCGVVAGIAASLALSACGGGGTEQSASEPSGTFPVSVAVATFPTFQRLAQSSRMVIAVRNTGQRAIPDIAVTITDPPYGTTVQAFGRYLPQPGLASHSRPVWIVDRPPGPCTFSCLNGGPGGAVTAYSNTWALGQLAPGQTATFVWRVTAVVAGTHVVRYEVAAGLNGKAKAQLSSGAIPTGTFKVRIVQQPQQSYVNSKGQIVVVK